MKRILVTGGAGFLGSHLCERLLHQKHYVLCLDNFYSSSESNVCHLKTFRNFELIRHDIINTISVEADEIYNLACPASPVHYQRDPVRTVKTCVVGAINALEIAKQCGARILQASTSEVYGDPEVHPQPETYHGHVNPIGKRSCYDEGKRCAETLFFDYYRQHGLSIRVARIFNTYGPRMDVGDGRVISNFILQALSQKPITVFGTGEQTRSFCYVDDMVSGLVSLMENKEEFLGPVNLGTEDEITMLTLAKTIIRATGSDSELRFCRLGEGDPKRRRPDISLARQRLSWAPQTALATGLAETIDYFKQNV